MNKNTAVRSAYVDAIEPFFHNVELVKIIQGMRRTGKSVILEQTRDRIIASGIPNDHVFLINFEDLQYSNIRDANSLNTFLLDMRIDNEVHYYLLDEVQFVKGFELAINSLRAAKKSSIFITGSNAHMLSTELSTHLAGRYVQWTVYPLSFKEMKQMNLGLSDQELFKNYLLWGSLPGRFHLENFQEENVASTYLSNVFDSIILRDIVVRSKATDVDLLEKIIQFSVDNTGNIFSVNTVSKFLKAQSRTVGSEKLYNYIGHILASMMLSKASRFDVKGKQVLATLEKYYINDLGLLAIRKGSTAKNYGARFETMIYNELLIRGYKVNVGMMRNAEIDFVATKPGETIYIQAAYEMDDEATIEREYAPFARLFTDSAQKLVITTEVSDYSKNGANQVNIIDWLNS